MSNEGDDNERKSALRSGVRAEDIADRARQVLEDEGRAILAKATSLGEGFVLLVDRLLSLQAHVVVTGVGKSGTIGEKISATLSSTGTPSFFLRPVEALHGDLGMLRPDDVLLAISNGGETSEVLAAVDAAHGLGVEIIAFTGRAESSLARRASIVVDTSVAREACPLGIAPTTSTTVTLALGDALAMALLDLRGFTRENYARLHPGGSLGQRLRFKVRDFLRTGDLIPTVDETDPLERALAEMTGKENIGTTLVTSAPSGRLVGILTDGDLRRVLLGQRGAGIPDRPVGELMSPDPRTIEPDASAAEALQVMEALGITTLAVVDPHGRPTGILHLHDILGRGKIVF